MSIIEKIKEHLHGEAEYDVRTLLREAFAELTGGNRYRRNRQKAVHEWCVAAFGDDHAKSIEQRGIRLVEEAIEAAQACGCDRAMVHRLVDHVYAKPVGELRQELGGVGVTMLALAHAAEIEADAAEFDEVERVLSKPLEYFRARNTAKNAAGFDALTPRVAASPCDPLVDRLGMLVSRLKVEAANRRTGYTFGEEAANARSGRIAEEIEKAIHEVRVLGKSHPQTAEEALLCRDSAGKLWCLHLRGPDEVHAAPSKEAAEAAAAHLSAWEKEHEVKAAPVAAPWPWSPESHAADLESWGEYAAPTPAALEEVAGNG